MNVIGISGLSNSVAFKRAHFPGLTAREYNIAQGFDAAAALVGAQGVVAAAAEERFTHQKATGAFPLHALRYCLQAGGLKPQDVDLVAHGFDYGPVKSLFEFDDAAQREYQEVYSPEVQRALLREHFPEADWADKFVPVPHHLAHAASAFYLSGFPEALILISDGMGETQSLTVAVGSGSNIRVLKEISAFHSLGMLYGAITLYLGFFMNSDEYKVMGLAPYGNPRRFYNQLMEFVSLKPDGTYTVPLFARNRTVLDRETHRGVLKHLVEQFGPAREPESEITQFHQDLAAGLQAVLQTCQMHVLDHWARQTGEKHLCMAGGVALNCSTNGVIKRSGRFERVFVQPAAGDDGTALGAALYAQRLHDPQFKPHRMSVPLWGPEFSDEEIRRELAGCDDCYTVEMESFDALCQEVAGRLAQGQIVAWFQGRMEFGPRALGSRSILADPRDATMRDRINSLVKKREEFRPFAPVVTREGAARYFELTPGDEDTYAHMLYVTPVREPYREKLPAVTHVDGSARVQTVGREHNARLWELLKAFEARTGLPVLLNTSFNVRGQPIVCTPQEAIDTFLAAGLDVLVAGNTLVLPQRRAAAVPPGEAAGAAPEVVQLELAEAVAEPLPLAAQIPALCMHQFFEEQARQTPDAVAAVFEVEQLTYGELDRRANQLAHHLRKLKVGPEVLVGICMEVSLEMLVSLLGVLKAGGAYVPLDPTYPRERLGFMIRDARLPVLLTQQRLSALLPEAIAQASAAQPGEARHLEPVLDATVVCVDTQWSAIEKESTEPVSSGVTPENLAYVIYTSGSTGKPKGVMVMHRNVANFFVGMDERIGAEPPGVWLAVTSISFDISVLELFWTLARGFKVVLQRKEERFSRAVPARGESGRRAMDFSLFYFASDQGAADGQKYRLLLEGAKFADEHDFTAVWTPERHFHAFGGLYPNPSLTSAAVAVLTRRVQIRAGSVVVPLHHPLRVAEEWAVVDNLSGGRVGISFASGWQVNDFVLAPEQYAQRKEVTLRNIELVRRLWRGETVTFPGANGQSVPVSILPRPIQRELPFWLTASGHPDTFKLAGQLGAHLLTHLLGQTTAQLAENLAAYHAAWAQSGHPGKGHVTLMLHTFVGEDLHTVREIVRGPFTAYLRSSIDLIKNTPWAFPTFKPPVAALAGAGGPNHGFTEEEVEFMARHAFERYFETSGFFGTPQTCLARVEQLRELGVDEIACLLDFGVETEAVLAGLELLDKVRQDSRQQTVRPRADYSLAAQVARHGVTHLQCTPSLAAMLVEEPQALEALRSLKCLMLGGEALPADLVQRLDLPGRLLNMYGPTETTIWSTIHTVDKAQKSVPIGRPIANTQTCLVDEHLQPMPEGTPGELLLGGAGVARGYLNRPELTAERFISHPGRPGFGGRWYRTGDLARYAPDGTIEFLGRIDQQVKLRGFRVELGEIEAALRQHPAVKDCAVTVSEVVPGDKRLFAYFVAAPGPLPALAELREFLEGKLPDFMVPAAFIPLAALPLTPNGKLDRKALPAPQAVPGLGKSFVAPGTSAEQKVAAIWREVLSVERVGLTDNFFELGGNSILATQMVSRLRRVFPGELPLELAFEFPTLQALAAHLDLTQQSSAATQESIQRRAEAQEWPLSFAQRRMWFLDQLEPGPHYNEHFHLRLHGPLDLAALQKACNEIVRRHESLRSTFSRVDGRPVQRPMSHLTLPLPLTDLSALPERERQAQAAALAVADTRKLFSLETGPLLRASLFRLGPEEHILALTFHHIIVDGWSRGVFLRELTALYEAFLAGRPSPLPELAIQYADFAAWQQDWLGGPVMDQHLSYWKQQLGSAPPLLEVPTDRPRPPVQTYRGSRLPVELDKATVDALSALGRQHGCTLYMVLLAAFQALLARYTGSQDIIVGSPVAQRNRPEIEGLIGYFLNSLVLRTSLAGEPSFTELLGRVRQVALDAYAHQDFPFEKLVAELQPERALGFSPMFQVMFILQTAAIPPEPVAGLRFGAFEIDSGVAKVDLTLSLEETPRGCSGWVEYATDLFDRATVERLFSHFRTLLAAVVAQPAARLSQLTLPGLPAPRHTPADLLGLAGRPGAVDAGRPGLEAPGRSSAPLLDLHAPPRSQVEKELARIWSEVLQVEKVGLHDTMFDLGGHSLLITMITARIRTTFQTDISIRAFFETPTLEAIAALIETNLGRRGVRPAQPATVAAAQS